MSTTAPEAMEQRLEPRADKDQRRRERQHSGDRTPDQQPSLASASPGCLASSPRETASPTIAVVGLAPARRQFRVRPPGQRANNHARAPLVRCRQCRHSRERSRRDWLLDPPQSWERPARGRALAAGRAESRSARRARRLRRAGAHSVVRPDLLPSGSRVAAGSCSRSGPGPRRGSSAARRRSQAVWTCASAVGASRRSSLSGPSIFAATGVIRSTQKNAAT
jgi:hypothetical protein